jgi:uncharacterized protein (TIGR00369 family)
VNTEQSPVDSQQGEGLDARNEREQELLTLFNSRAPIARLFGMRLSYTALGEALIELPYNPNLDHALGGVHGGVYATLLDSAGWFAAAIRHEVNNWMATGEMSIHFLRTATRTDLRAVGRVLKAGKRQDIVEMLLYDGQDTLVGHATGTFIVISSVSIG